VRVRMNLNRRSFGFLLGCAVAAPAFPTFAQGVPAAFPQQPITFIVPFSAGGPVDVLGRLLAQAFQDRTGHASVVDNKTGGAGNIGIDAVRKSTPDGTTLLVIPAGNLTINPTLMSNISFNVERDFAPITLLATAPNIILASKEFGAKTVADIVAKAKTRKITYGSPGVGSQLHLAMELLKDKTGADLQHVPYRGSAQAISDLLGNHIDLLVTNLPVVLGVVREGKAVPIAMTTAERSNLVPDVPTLAEAGIQGIDVTSWYGLLAPRKTPQPVLDALFDVTADVMKTPAVQDKMSAQGLSVVIEQPDKFAARIQRESALWADVIRRNKIAPE
jgi:tripartite-type tricarboxylate transporter receptor subunit TctC